MRRLLTLIVLAIGSFWALSTGAYAQNSAREVLAFYYGWYGNPKVTGNWVHWQGVDPANAQIKNSVHFPAFGAYDSHDPAVVDRQAAAARAAGLTGFIASWWGQGSFEDQGMPLLLNAAGRHGLSISAYYEKIPGKDTSSRIRAAVADLDYLLARYGTDKAWLHDGGKPVLFLYGRAVHQLSQAEWQDVVAQVRRDNPGGVVIIVNTIDPGIGDSFDPQRASVFDGTSASNITGQTQHKSPQQIREWAHVAYPKMVAAAAGKVSTVTVIPGFDDRATDRRPPRPVTERWGGETYRALWQQAVAAHPDYVLIASWNEWHEGSEIEPSVEYDSIMLNDTAGFARAFLADRK
jgi:glycoprotein endo-alpha-1,2-mannosidase